MKIIAWIKKLFKKPDPEIKVGTPPPVPGIMIEKPDPENPPESAE